MDRSDRHHRWAEERNRRLPRPLLVCEAVLAEATHLLGRFSAAPEGFFRLIEGGALVIAFQMREHVPALRQLLAKYRDRPMSLADACIVRMAEIYDGAAVFTLDSDFTFYRKNGRTPIDLIFPATS
jgi:predicted nucleic acid-binding protein